ncbi:MAG TPA: GlxA family transcriptional regulator [Allosphingosinicella sp.]|jgi:transcriptional regulator GlxA family with amidase domain
MLRVGFVLVPGFQMMSLAAASAFEFANLVAGEPLYRIDILAERGGPVANSFGVPIEAARLSAEGHDTLIFGSGISVADSPDTVVRFARESLGSVRRMASICTGAFILAEAGVLDSRRATTHWLVARELQSRYPAVQVEEDRIFIVDGPVWTSAGMSAGIDLALGMIEKDFGPDLARAVAQRLVLYHRRGGGQSQHSALLALTPKSDRIQNALAYARSNLKSHLSVEELAEAARLSPRQFSRAFRAETGQTPARAVENLRLEAARLMLEQSRHPVDVIATETGFADRERMRRAFVRAFGQPPIAIRRSAAGSPLMV